MHRRYLDRDGEPGQMSADLKLPPRSEDPVLALQRSIGNRATAQVLARDAKSKNRPSFEHSVTIGKHGPIEIKGGNIYEWAAKQDPDDLKLVTAKGSHSDELKRLFEKKERFAGVETASVVGENTLMTISFKNCRIKRYSEDGGTEEWILKPEIVKRHSVSLGAAR